MIYTLLAACLFAVIPFGATEIPKGRSAWVYDVLNGEPAMWANTITAFNTNFTDHAFNIIFSYGGDMEYYPGTNEPYRTYFANPDAVTKYNSITGVTDVIAIVDGRMDGDKTWSPDLALLNQSALQEWADLTSGLYCSYENVAGVAIDLEPFADPYRQNLLVFLTRLGQNLASNKFGCVTERFPTGRYLSTFLFAEAATQEVYTALGPNGFTIISGYDLSEAPAGVASTPVEYGARFASALKTVMSNIGESNGKFMVAIPAAASTHEFTSYVPNGGDTVKGYPMYSTTEDNYLARAFEAFETSGVESHPGYLGPSVWGFSSFMSYPPHSDNLFFPSTPFVLSDEENFLGQNL